MKDLDKSLGSSTAGRLAPAAAVNIERIGRAAPIIAFAASMYSATEIYQAWSTGDYSGAAYKSVDFVVGYAAAWAADDNYLMAAAFIAAYASAGGSEGIVNGAMAATGLCN